MGKSDAAFYARNAARGRTVRFTLKTDISHVPADAAAGMVGINVKGTLTPRDARRITAIVLGTEQDEVCECSRCGAKLVGWQRGPDDCSCAGMPGAGAG